MSPAPIAVDIDGSAFGYQFHQVAIFCPAPAHSPALIANQEPVQFWQAMGYDRWLWDNAVLKGILDGEPVETRASMAFNYDIMPMELEFLAYDGPSRHAGRAAAAPYISHMSVYVDDVVHETKKLMREYGLRPPYHRFITTQHTNPGVVGKKRFIESIFDTSRFLGYDVKLIQKVDWNYRDEDWLGLDI